MENFRVVTAFVFVFWARYDILYISKGGGMDMFFDDSLKGVKKELKAAGVDISFVKNWQKTYDKVRKQRPALEGQYIQVKKELQMVYTTLKDMEKLFVSCEVGTDFADVQKKLGGFIKELKKYQKSFVLEFLIGKEDREFHLTYSAIIALGEKKIQEKSDTLIIQSEVENLMAITKEALDKEWPDFRAMTYFYLEYSDKELLELPHREKVEKVVRIYEREFYNPMLQIVENALGEERARKIMEDELWN